MKQSHKIAILGFGREGKSVLQFLKKSPSYKGAEITILDAARNKNYLKGLEKYDIIFRSPGVPYLLPEIQTAVKHGCHVTSATKLFFSLCPGKIIGITGTKGKGTTSTMLYEILRGAGKKVVLAGNIGTPMLDVLPRVTKSTLVILELSSFQLQDLEVSPAIAAIVEMFPDHLDVHKNMQEYVTAKTNIACHQNSSDAVFYFSADPIAKKMASNSKGKKIAVTAPDDLRKNFIIAGAIARHLGCSARTIEEARITYRNLPYRLELVRTVGKMRFYNDSASTNPQTAAAAIASVTNDKQPIVLIAGGKDKNLDYKPLAAAIKKSKYVVEIILIGENKNKIQKAVGASTPIQIAHTLQEAVTMAYETLQIYKSGAVLFSPAAASFDMFKDYEDRGRQFTKIVKRMKS